MIRILGLDVGSVRVGVALSDPLGVTAQPLEVIDRRRQDPWVRIGELVAEHGVERVVVGYPVRLEGDEGPAVAAVNAFVEKLREHVAATPIEAYRKAAGGPLGRYLQGLWTLVYVGDGTCDAACNQELYRMRQVRLAQNENMQRVQTLYLLLGNRVPETVRTLADKQYPDLEVMLRKKAWITCLPVDISFHWLC